MIKATNVFLMLTALLFSATSTCNAQVFDEQFDHWPLDLKINGKVIVAGEVEAAVPLLAKLISQSDREQRVAVVLTPPSDDLQTEFEEFFNKAESLEFTSPETVEDVAEEQECTADYGQLLLHELHLLPVLQLVLFLPGGREGFLGG